MSRKRKKLKQEIRVESQQIEGASKEKETAYHEAGHAVAAFELFGINRVRKISIIPKEKDHSLGRLIPKKIRMQPDACMTPGDEINLMNMIVESYAGVLAGKKITGRYNHRGADSDYNYLVKCRGYITGGCDPQLNKYLDNYLFRRAELLVNGRWPQIEAVAKELLKKKELNNGEFHKIIIDSSREQVLKWQKNKNHLLTR